MMSQLTKEQIRQLWDEFIKPIRVSSIQMSSYFFEFAYHIAAEQHRRDSAKTDAWDKVRQFSQEMGNYTITDIMDNTLNTIIKDRADDELRRNSGVESSNPIELHKRMAQKLGRKPKM